MAYVNKKSGIYKISIIGSDKVYIGLTNNLLQRKNEHTRALNENKHFNVHLQRAFQKYGKDSLVIELVEECDVSMLNEREKHHIKEFDSFNNGFNMTTGGERCLISDDVKKRISEKHIGKVVKESTRQKLREANLGKKMPQDVKDKISVLNKNRIFTDEQREKISKAAKLERTPEMRKKLSIANTGKTLTSETKLKLAAFNLKRIRPNSIIEIKNYKVYIDGYEYIKGKRIPIEEDEFQRKKRENIKNGRIKFSNTRMGHIVSLETRDKISKAGKGRKMTEEQRIANSERQKGKKQTEEFKQKLRDYYKRKREEKWDANLP